MILAINHIQITIPKGKEPQTKNFYCELLGLKEIEKPEVLKQNGGFWLELANIQIHVGTEDGVAREKTKSHIAYEVSDIIHWKNIFHSADIKVNESQSVLGYQRINIRDPFGNKIELMAKN